MAAVSGFYTFLCLLMAILLPPVGVVMRIGVGKVRTQRARTEAQREQPRQLGEQPRAARFPVAAADLLLLRVRAACCGRISLSTFC
jgi:hypothetical protein